MGKPDTWVNGGCVPPNITSFQGFSASLPWSPLHLSLNFGSAPAVCPQDGSHNSPTQSWYSEITGRVGQGQWLRNKSLQEDTEWMRLGSCGLCSQLPEALQQLVQGFSLFGARSSIAPWGALLCTVRCLAASLTSTSWMPVAPLKSGNQNYLQTLPMSPWGWGQSHPKLRTNDLESTVVVP